MGYGEAIIGNWRATPTTEVKEGKLQPYDGVVHNGTIANAEELGLEQGQIDSEILPRVLRRTGVDDFLESVRKLKGSYAIGCVAEVKNDVTLYLACNYKPIYIWKDPQTKTVFFSSMARHFIGACPNNPMKMKPYSVYHYHQQVCDVRDILAERTKKYLVVCSGGLDSTHVANKIFKSLRTDIGTEVESMELLHFNYGCRASNKEFESIRNLAEFFKCTYRIVDIPQICFNSKEGSNSTLFDTKKKLAGPVEGAEYAHEWVPARNLIFLSMATAIAETEGFTHIALGNNLEESGAYPDNEEEFNYLFNQLLPHATQNERVVELVCPVSHLMKHEIVKEGLALDTPFYLTWSCYEQNARPCWKCGPDFMRAEAFFRNSAIDPLLVQQIYETCNGHFPTIEEAKMWIEETRRRMNEREVAFNETINCDETASPLSVGSPSLPLPPEQKLASIENPQPIVREPVTAFIPEIPVKLVDDTLEDS